MDALKRRKDEQFTEEHVKLALFARSLSHPARIAIVGFLKEKGESPCGAIVEAIPLAQSTVSQHIRALYDAGLIKVRNCGTSMCYSLNFEIISTFCHAFQCTLGTVAENKSQSFE